MRVCQFVQQPALRGAEVFAKQLSAALRARGHATRTIYLYSAQEPRLAIEPGDVVLDAPPRHPLERILIQPGVLSRLTGAVDAFAPDVIQLNGGRAVKYGAALRHVRRRDPWVCVYRNIGDPEYWIRGIVKRAAYRLGVFSGVDGIVALSEHARSVFTRRFNIHAPMDVIPTGVSPEDLVPAEPRRALRGRMGVSDSAPVVLYVGKLAPEKRVDRLIAAFSRATENLPLARLWVVGEGPERPKLERQVTEFGMGARVRFEKPTSSVGSYYAGADVFALTSDSEGIPGVVLEAAFSGLPVVATDVGLVRECVLEGESALLARPDEASVAEALGRLLRDPALRQRLGRRGRALVEERYLMSDIAERYEKFYRQVLETRAR